MIVSTPSYGGGSDLWDERRSAPLSTRLRHMQTDASPAAMDDGKLEVVGVVRRTAKHHKPTPPRSPRPADLPTSRPPDRAGLRTTRPPRAARAAPPMPAVAPYATQTDVLHLANALGGISNGVRLCQGSSIAVSAVSYTHLTLPTICSV
eukprot:2147502-Prymnesium_polylepis.1